MTPGGAGARALAAAVLLSTAALGGCSLSRPGSATTGDSSSGVRSGQVVLTARGAMSVLRGDTASISQAVEDMFENLDIYLVGESSDNGGKTMRGRAGRNEIIVEMEPESDRQVQVNVRVREPGSGTRGRWDRLAARGLVEEIRRWSAR